MTTYFTYKVLDNGFNNIEDCTDLKSQAIWLAKEYTRGGCKSFVVDGDTNEVVFGTDYRKAA